MADPKKLRADANALVTELLQRLAAEDVQQLEIRRGGLRVKVSKNGTPALAAAQSTPAASRCRSSVTRAFASARSFFGSATARSSA